MPSIRVCALFRPLNSKEKSEHGDSVCIRGIDSESFIFKDDKEEEVEFCFDRVFFQGSEQADIYEFLALPIVKVNGAIITYGQTGAGKTYSMEGPSIIDCNENQKGLLPRVVDGLFNAIKSSDDLTKYTIKLSMVEIYLERVRSVSLEKASVIPYLLPWSRIMTNQNSSRVDEYFSILRDLFDLAKDNLQIKESKAQGIFVNGVTENGIANRTIQETRILHILTYLILRQARGAGVHFPGPHRYPFSLQLTCIEMNMASSRSHCIYLFLIQQDLKKEKRYGKLMLVDLAGSEKAEKTGAEGRVLEEAKTINKSLSALGNVINALSSPGKANHIPYRDSKLTRILQDALGGSSQTAFLCCCSPSPSSASESLSTLRFGARANHVKAVPRLSLREDEAPSSLQFPSSTKSESCGRILEKMSKRMKAEDVQLLEQLLILEGIFFHPNSVEEVELAYEDVTSRTISSLKTAVEQLRTTSDELKRENQILKGMIKNRRCFLQPIQIMDILYILFFLHCCFLINVIISS